MSLLVRLKQSLILMEVLSIPKEQVSAALSSTGDSGA